MWVKCHHRPAMGWLVFLSVPQDTHLAWLKTNDAHKHTHTHKEKRKNAVGDHTISL